MTHLKNSNTNDSLWRKDPHTLYTVPVEHVLNDYTNVQLAARQVNSTSSVLRQYMLRSHHHLFQYLGYSHACAVFATMTQILATFSWNFMDLFIVIAAIALTERFRVFNRHLQAVRGKVPLYLMIEWKRNLVAHGDAREK